MSHPLPRTTEPERLEGNDDRDTRMPQEPSWFPEGTDAHFDALVERYRQRRQEAVERAEREDRGERGEMPVPHRPLPRPVLPPQETAAQRRYYREYPHEAEAEQAPRRRRGSRRVALVAGGVSLALLGGSFGFALSRTGEIVSFVQNAVARFAPAPDKPAAVAAKPSSTTIAKSLVPTATLDVADVSGSLNSFIPLMLRASPGVEGQDIALKLSGLPKEAYLTAGSKTGPNDWVVTLHDAEQLKLVVPRADANHFDVEVAAVEARTGQLAAPVKEMTVAIDSPDLKITPVSAEPETATQPAPAIRATAAARPAAVVTATGSAVAGTKVAEAAPETMPEGVARLLQKGEVLLKSGDMPAARQFFEQAYAMGAADGALGLAKTYDPLVYKSLNVVGIAPDRVQAMNWYGKAAAAGQADASAAIAALSATPQ